MKKEDFNMKKRMLSIMMVAAMVGTMLAGCGSSTADTGTTGEAGTTTDTSATDDVATTEQTTTSGDELV